MKLKAFKIKQWGYGEGAGETPLYLTVMKVKDLEKCDIDRWTKSNKSGYQREPDKRRISEGKNSIISYLLKELGAFPTSVLLNVRGEITFKPLESSNGIEFGELIIPDREKPIIIDGQHRIFALVRAKDQEPELEEYPTPVTILNLNDKFDEMLHFYLVNSRQKRIKTDLVYKHLQTMKERISTGEKQWVNAILGQKQVQQALATIIVDILDQDPNSPFKDEILYVGDEKEETHHIIRDYTLATYISKILRERALQGISEERFAELYADYWMAIKELYPKCFSNPREYTLLKSTGVASFTYLFPTIFAYCASDGDLSKSNMKNYLSELKEQLEDAGELADIQKSINEEWWSRAHGPSIAWATSEKVFNEISSKMAKKIEIVRRKKGLS